MDIYTASAEYHLSTDVVFGFVFLTTCLLTSVVLVTLLIVKAKRNSK